MNMRKWNRYAAGVLMGFACLLVACGGSDGEEAPQPTLTTETMTLIIAVPQTEETRVGDPGTSTNEGEDWDKLAVIVTYPDYSGTDHAAILKRVISKDEYENLEFYSGNKNYKMLPIDVWEGDIHIYGVTYSDGVKDNPENDIYACTSDDDVQALTISNGYADGDASVADKFLSVATGYYKDDSGNIATYTVGQNADYGELKPTPSIELTRLAAKIDIQWDAQDAYDAGYTDVKVEGFTFYNNATDMGADGEKGKGYLFPKLTHTSAATAGSSTFYNTTEISKRNGRVYHYVFPDGKSTPKVTFNLSAAGNSKKTYTFTFPSQLASATWYKINTTVKGLTNASTTITLTNKGK